MLHRHENIELCALGQSDRSFSLEGTTKVVAVVNNYMCVYVYVQLHNNLCYWTSM